MDKHADYFEGILQLRDANKDIFDFVKKSINKQDKDFLTKVVKVRNGMDIYLKSNKFLMVLGKKLKKHFNGEMKISAKLHTKSRVTSKEVHRVNILFRPLKFKVGSIIKFKGDELRIMKIGGKVTAKNIETGKRILLSFNDLLK